MERHIHLWVRFRSVVVKGDQLKKLVRRVSLGVAAAAVTVGSVAAMSGTASAASVYRDNLTINECRNIGNQLVESGRFSTYSCVSQNDGWRVGSLYIPPHYTLIVYPRR